MNSSIYILVKSSSNIEESIDEVVAASFNLNVLEKLMVTLENKKPDIPEVVWKKYRRYALKKDPTLDDYLYGIAMYTFEHSKDNYTLDQLKEAEDYYEGEFSTDVYIIDEIPFINE